MKACSESPRKDFKSYSALDCSEHQGILRLHGRQDIQHYLCFQFCVSSNLGFMGFSKMNWVFKYVPSTRVMFHQTCLGMSLVNIQVALIWQWFWRIITVCYNTSLITLCCTYCNSPVLSCSMMCVKTPVALRH